MTTENRVKGLIEIRDCVRTLLEYQTEDYPDEDIKREQVKLNQLYDRFTKKYGLINSRGNNSAFSNDSSYYLLCSLEILDENGNLARTIIQKTKVICMFDMLKNTKKEEKTGKKLKEQFTVQLKADESY